MAPCKTPITTIYKLVLDTDIPHIEEVAARPMKSKIRLANGSLTPWGCSKYEYFRTREEAEHHRKGHIQIRISLCIKRIACQQQMMDRLTQSI